MQSGIHALQLRWFPGILATRNGALPDAGLSSREDAAARVVPIEMDLQAEVISGFSLTRLILLICEDS